MRGFDYWLLLNFGYVLVLGALLFLMHWFINVRMPTQKHKIRAIVAMYSVVFLIILFTVMQWRKQTIEHIELHTTYLEAHYLSGRKMIWDYRDIADVKWYSNTNRYTGFRQPACGLALTLRTKEQNQHIIRTAANRTCEDAAIMRKEIMQKVEKSI
ncbi:hypothetical protein ACKLNO_10660 [Neisseriaceae bacterium B1]